jgi:hypothetical protein
LIFGATFALFLLKIQLFFAFFVESLANLRHVPMAPPPADEHNLYINEAPSVLNVPGVPGPLVDDSNWAKIKNNIFTVSRVRGEAV